MDCPDAEQVSRVLAVWSRVCMTTTLRLCDEWKAKHGKTLDLSINGGSYLVTPGKERLSLRDWLEMRPELLAEMGEPPTQPERLTG
jgi:hypothetical protein